MNKMECWHDGNIDCLPNCELIENCPDRARVIEIISPLVMDVMDRLADIENTCIDHTENDIGEWETMEIDYSKWADVFIAIKEFMGVM